jgi:hypothetical protein
LRPPFPGSWAGGAVAGCVLPGGVCGWVVPGQQQQGRPRGHSQGRCLLLGLGGWRWVLVQGWCALNGAPEGGWATLRSWPAVAAQATGSQQWGRRRRLWRPGAQGPGSWGACWQQQPRGRRRRCCCCCVLVVVVTRCTVGRSEQEACKQTERAGGWPCASRGAKAERRDVRQPGWCACNMVPPGPARVVGIQPHIEAIVRSDDTCKAMRRVRGDEHSLGSTPVMHASGYVWVNAQECVLEQQPYTTQLSLAPVECSKPADVLHVGVQAPVHSAGASHRVQCPG